MRETKPRTGLFVLAAALVLLALVPARQVWADTLPFTDGFEGYALGALDKNLSGGPNAAPNGSGNPWFGPAPPNARVIGAEGGVNPHSGNQMIRGAPTGPDLDENWVNLAYRFNGGNPYTGDIALDWWFYDPAGAGSTAFRDYAAIGYYNTAPSNTDYPGTGSLNSSTQIQRLSLGAPYNSSSGYNNNFYQARVVGATDGYAGTTYFNTNTGRSVGWHHGRIVVGPALADSTNDVYFYIDDMANPTFTHNSVTKWGYNVIEINTMYGTISGYFDDVTFVPEPATLLVLGASALFVRRRRA
jgi:hypothetical protein